MRSVCVLLLAMCGAVANEAASVEWSFEDATAGKLPPRWTEARTGEGPGSVWKVVEDPSAPAGPKVLAQTSAAGPNPLFNLCLAEGATFANLDLEVSFKAVAGKQDQGGGPVWRYRDADNYYVARMNPLEGNFRVYKVVNGKRTQLGTGDVDAPTGRWHRIRVIHQGDRIRCYLNDRQHLEVKDGTFQEAGQVGLWTKADAVTYFDALKVGTPRE